LKESKGEGYGKVLLWLSGGRGGRRRRRRVGGRYACKWEARMEDRDLEGRNWVKSLMKLKTANP
jgi:hypothetical protein